MWLDKGFDIFEDVQHNKVSIKEKIHFRVLETIKQRASRVEARHVVVIEISTRKQRNIEYKFLMLVNLSLNGAFTTAKVGDRRMNTIGKMDMFTFPGTMGKLSAGFPSTMRIIGTD